MTSVDKAGGANDYYQPADATTTANSADSNNPQVGESSNKVSTDTASAEELKEALAKAAESLKELLINTKTSGQEGIFSEKPTLEPSHLGNISNEELKGMGIEAIMLLLNNEDRTASLQATKTSLEIQSSERSRIAQEKVENLQEQCKKIEEQMNASKISKIFKGISAIFNAIAGLATAALGVMTGNPLLIAGGICTTITAVDQAMSVLSDGELSLSKSIASLFGGSDKAQQIVSYVMIGVGCLGALLSGIGGGGDALTSVASLISGITQIGVGVTDMQIAISRRDLGIIQSDAKHLEAMMERLQTFQQSALDVLKALMEQKEAAAEAVNDVVKNCNDSLKNIVTSNAPGAGAMMA